MSNDKSSDQSATKKALIFSGIGFELLALMLAALYLGQALDQRYQWNGLATVGLSLVALVGWFVHLIRLLQNFSSDAAKEKNKS